MSLYLIKGQYRTVQLTRDTTDLIFAEG